jgi:seryl-tRNA synthetase
MTSKEFFVFTLKDELPRFKRVLEAMPGDKLDYTPHPKQKTAAQMCALFLNEPPMLVKLVKEGVYDSSNWSSHATESTPAEASASMETNFAELLSLVESTSEEDWQQPAKLTMGEQVLWETTKEKMLWSFLLDLVHHRGQISTYLRPMGGKVPSIYGPSGDSEDTGV